MSVRIRVATSLDRDDIRDIHLSAFPECESQLVAELAANLLNEDTDPETITLVAEAGGQVVGHIAFSPVTADSRNRWLGYILGPLGVKPEYHKAGIGSKLVKGGIERLSEKGVNVVFVYGDPEFYRRFGFSVEAATRFLPPYELKYPFGWQAMTLHESGTNERAVQLSCAASLRNPALW